MGAKPDETLAKQWAKYAGPAKVAFQSNHWMDTPKAIQYNDWLKSLYPTQKTGLIWDYAGPHVCAEVLSRANSLGIIIEFININKGMTSVQQPCDLFANQQIKQLIKFKYYENRMV